MRSVRRPPRAAPSLPTAPEQPAIPPAPYRACSGLFAAPRRSFTRRPQLVMRLVVTAAALAAFSVAQPSPQPSPQLSCVYSNNGASYDLTGLASESGVKIVDSRGNADVFYDYYVRVCNDMGAGGAAAPALAASTARTPLAPRCARPRHPPPAAPPQPSCNYTCGDDQNVRWPNAASARPPAPPSHRCRPRARSAGPARGPPSRSATRHPSAARRATAWATRPPMASS